MITPSLCLSTDFSSRSSNLMNCGLRWTSIGKFSGSLAGNRSTDVDNAIKRFFNDTCWIWEAMQKRKFSWWHQPFNDLRNFWRSLFYCRTGKKPISSLIRVKCLIITERYSGHIMTPSSQSAISAVCHLLMGDPIAIPTRNWHFPEHAAKKEAVQQLITYLISQRRPNASAEWLSRLTEISKRLERRVYLAAKSIEE